MIHTEAFEMNYPMDDEDSDFEKEFNTDEMVDGHRTTKLYAAWRDHDGHVKQFKNMNFNYLKNVKKFIERKDSNFIHSRVYKSLCNHLRFKHNYFD